MRKTPLKRGQPLKRGSKPMARKPMRRRPSPNGFPDQTKKAVRARSKGLCEAGSCVCTGKAEHFHHRQSRRHKNQSPANCLHICQACHALIHDHEPVTATLMGWLVSAYADPTRVPVVQGERYVVR